jgi:hypothetical protein
MLGTNDLQASMPSSPQCVQRVSQLGGIPTLPLSWFQECKSGYQKLIEISVTKSASCGTHSLSEQPLEQIPNVCNTHAPGITATAGAMSRPAVVWLGTGTGTRARRRRRRCCCCCCRVGAPSPSAPGVWSSAAAPVVAAAATADCRTAGRATCLVLGTGTGSGVGYCRCSCCCALPGVRVGAFSPSAPGAWSSATPPVVAVAPHCTAAGRGSRLVIAVVGTGTSGAATSPSSSQTATCRVTRCAHGVTQ